MFRIKELSACLSVSVAALLTIGLSGTASADVLVPNITFASAADYDNTLNTVTGGPITPHNNQTGGKFRDKYWWSINNGVAREGSPDYINRANSLVLSPGVGHAVPGAGPYTALDFTGPAVSGQNYLTLYDTNVATSAPTLFDFSAYPNGTKISADFLFIKHSVSAGLVALLGEGALEGELALLAHDGDGNNSDSVSLKLISANVGAGTVLGATVTLPSTTFVSGNWYRITMDLSVTGDTWNLTGIFQNHLTPTDPTSGLNNTLIATLVRTGLISNPDPSNIVLKNPGEIGLLVQANEGITGAGCAPPFTGTCTDNVGVSVTNFEVVPEPATLVLFGGGLLGLGASRRRRKKV